MKLDLDDEELIEKARAATNGPKFERLWNGNTSGYESQSEADMALCCLLAFWTGGDPTQVDRLFRESALSRKKWDEVHYADGSTYGEKTSERAIANTSEFYDPDAVDESPNSYSTGASTADADRDEAERSRTYLAEKNRLLTERIDELEATLERKTERIETLEAAVERLTDKHGVDDRVTERTVADPTVTVNDNEEGSETETTSVWGRTKRLFGEDSE